MPDPEDSARLVERFVELFRPDAFFFVRPNQYQMGPVMYYKDEGVRKWADYKARTFFELTYYINNQTARKITTQLIYSTPIPWGGLAVSVEFTAIYAFRDGEKRYTVPGAAFFQFAEDGRIKRLRLYELKDETLEVIP